VLTDPSIDKTSFRVSGAVLASRTSIPRNPGLATPRRMAGPFEAPDPGRDVAAGVKHGGV